MLAILVVAAIVPVIALVVSPQAGLLTAAVAVDVVLQLADVVPVAVGVQYAAPAGTENNYWGGPCWYN